MADKHSLGLFGQLVDGRLVHSFTLHNQAGSELKVMSYGATIVKLKIPAKDGLTDIVLGFDTIEDYIYSHDLPAAPYFGAVAGRYSGRIKNGQFAIDGTDHQLSVNNNSNTLHGGKNGFDRRMWKFVSVEDSSATLEYKSADGEEGFPGELTVRVKYSLSQDNIVTIEYEAETTADTIINLTQHSYFNLEGHESDLSDQELLINSTILLETDQELVPTGKLIAASDKDFDFSSARKCPTGIDDSFVIADKSRPAATLTSQKNELRMTVVSDQESLHIYVGGNCFGEIRGKNGADYHTCSGICFESQNYPDAPNHANFPSSVLRKGERYHQITKWIFERI